MTVFQNIQGNHQIKKYLKRMVLNKAIANSLLFAGADGIGKSLFAHELAKLMIIADNSDPSLAQRIDSGNHPDIHVYRPEGKIGMHSIQTMRQFSEEVYLAPFEAKWKIFIIHDADRMLTYSANALLKTFEEPSKDSVIILLSDAPQSLLPTVLSRCRTLRFSPLSNQEVSNILQNKANLDLEKAQQIAALSAGSPGKAFRLLAQGGEQLRKNMLELLATRKYEYYPEMIKAARSIADQIEESKKQEEETLRKELLKVSEENLPAAQLAGIEKEIDGAVAMQLAKHAYSLFEVILSWYRDLHLLQAKGNDAYLINQDFKEELKQALQLGKVTPLEEIQSAIKKATLAVERSTPLNTCLEMLFLQLIPLL